MHYFSGINMFVLLVSLQRSERQRAVLPVKPVHWSKLYSHFTELAGSAQPCQEPENQSAHGQVLPAGSKSTEVRDELSFVEPHNTVFSFRKALLVI